jgi:hypothetical protein
MAKRYIVLQSDVEVIQQFRPVHHNTSGYYHQGEAGDTTHHWIIASITEFDGKPFDWAAYEGWTTVDTMSVEQQQEAIKSFGDKVWSERAIKLMKAVEPKLAKVRYRE